MQKFDSDITLVEMVYVGEILALIILSNFITTRYIIWYLTFEGCLVGVDAGLSAIGQKRLKIVLRLFMLYF